MNVLQPSGGKLNTLAGHYRSTALKEYLKTSRIKLVFFLNP